MYSIMGQTYFNLEVLQSENPVVVFFTAVWCRSCHPIGHRLNQLEETYKGRVKFYQIDIDNEREICETQQITRAPTVVIFRNGTTVNTIISGGADIVQAEIVRSI